MVLKQALKLSQVSRLSQTDLYDACKERHINYPSHSLDLEIRALLARAIAGGEGVLCTHCLATKCQSQTIETPVKEPKKDSKTEPQKVGGTEAVEKEANPFEEYSAASSPGKPEVVTHGNNKEQFICWLRVFSPLAPPFLAKLFFTPAPHGAQGKRNQVLLSKLSPLEMKSVILQRLKPRPGVIQEQTHFQWSLVFSSLLLIPFVWHVGARRREIRVRQLHRLTLTGASHTTTSWCKSSICMDPGREANSDQLVVWQPQWKAFWHRNWL